MCGQVEPVDGVEEFAALVDQAAGQGLVGLLLVPWAPVPAAQPGDGPTQIVNGAHRRRGWGPRAGPDKDSGLVFAHRV